MKSQPFPFQKAGSLIQTILFLFIAIGFGNPLKGLAHTRSESFSSWHLRPATQSNGKIDTIDVSLSLRMDTVQRLYGQTQNISSLKRQLLQEVAEEIVLSADGTPCRQSGLSTVIISENTGYLRLEWSLKCPAASKMTITFRAFFRHNPRHIHIARMSILGAPLVEKLFTAENSEWHIRDNLSTKGNQKTSGPVGSSLASYWKIGMQHIISGFDHIAFLLGLLLLCRKRSDIITLISGFTIGHTLILGLGLYGVISPDSTRVEFLIGYTIALVAVENVSHATGRNMASVVGVVTILVALIGSTLITGGPSLLTLFGISLFSVCYLQLVATVKKRDLLLRTAVTVLFGFIHGSGFAGSLSHIGLPADRYLTALFGFNLGVETGQLALVGVFGIFVQISVRLVPLFSSETWNRTFHNLTTAVLCGMGLFWFIDRAFT